MTDATHGMPDTIWVVKSNGLMPMKFIIPAVFDLFDGPKAKYIRADLHATVVRERDALAAEVEGLRKHLAWALEEMDAEGEGSTPPHECGYEVAPDTAHCDFHERYHLARAALTAEQPHQGTAPRGEMEG